MNKAVKRSATHPNAKHAPPPDTSASKAPETLLVQQSYQGPLPDPRTFEQYNIIVPGAAERILVMAEESAKHAREMDVSILQAQIDVEKQNHLEAKIGQAFGMISTLALSAVAIYALNRGYQAVASIICSTTVVGMVVVFVTGRKRKTKENGNA